MAEKVDIERLKADLKEAGVEFGNRSGEARLIALAEENGIKVPYLDEEPEGGNIVPKKYRDRYGSKQHCGDEMAEAFKDFVTRENEKGKKFCDPAALSAIASQNNREDALARWAHLNIGQQRMNLGNVLRGMLNRGERVQVGDRIWEAVPKDETSDEIASKMG